MENIIVMFIAQAIFLLYPSWRIYSRAGINSSLSLTVLIPYFGIIICALILVFSKWDIRQKGMN